MGRRVAAHGGRQPGLLPLRCGSAAHRSLLESLARPGGPLLSDCPIPAGFCQRRHFWSGLGPGPADGYSGGSYRFCFCRHWRRIWPAGGAGRAGLFCPADQPGFFIALAAQTSFEQLLAAGIGIILSLQTLTITAGTLKLMPLTGVTLPFVSYGGSSLVTSFVMVGMLLFIARQRKSVQTFKLFHLPLAWGLFTGFMIVAGGLIFWQVVLAPFLTRRDDNPRPVVAEQGIRRGRLLTASGVPVAETIINEQGIAERRYPYAGLSSVTGYYSIRYGVGGTEAVFDPVLRGVAGKSVEDQWLDDLLHRPLVGRDITLTINLPAQVAADVALGDQEGAVVVMEIETGAILVMSSHPTYDPNTLEANWDVLRQDQRAPLLNRATQGLFPVGDLARLVGLIGLREAGATLPADPLVAPLAEILAPLSQPGYLATARQLGLMRPLPGLPSQVGRLPDFENRGTVRDLAVTPLHLARVIAGLELAGRLPTPLLHRTETNPLLSPTPSFRPDTAAYVRALLSQVDRQMVGFQGVATPLETGQRSLSWLVGLAPAEALQVEAKAEAELVLDPTQITSPTPAAAVERPAARYVVVAVVVTAEPDSGAALRIARAPLKVLLSP
ncbi:MAG: FtsW/RodA/SpoVE family cell cycle protein [Anaerolineales bacterium]|nr:FtsW/RodA/SpoVE family cell cycle protein [Anaerolineales bacterium]